MELPRKVAVGSEITTQVGELLGELELGGEVPVLSGPNVKELVGEELTASLHKGGFRTKWKLVGPSTFQEVERVSRLSKH